MSGKFNRRHEVAIRIGGDTWEDVVSALHNILFIADSEGPGHDSVSGGPSFGYIFVDQEHPEVTHDSYFEEVDAWIGERRKEKSSSK